MGGAKWDRVCKCPLGSSALLPASGDPLLSDQVSGTRPHSWVRPQLQALCATASGRGYQAAGCSDPSAHSAGRSDRDAYLRGARPQVPALTKGPEGQQGGEDELHVWGPEETPANEGSATCACSAPFIQGLVTSQGLSRPEAQ